MEEMMVKRRVKKTKERYEEPWKDCNKKLPKVFATGLKFDDVKERMSNCPSRQTVLFLSKVGRFLLGDEEWEVRSLDFETLQSRKLCKKPTVGISVIGRDGDL